MKRLFLLVFILLSSTSFAQNNMVELDGIQIHYTRTYMPKYTQVGVIDCWITTTYYRHGAQVSSGSSESCNYGLYNCDYLGLCPSSGNNEAYLQAIIDSIQELGDREYPWSNGVRHRHK